MGIIMLNPYSNRKMITKAEDFFGRRKELRQIYSQLQTSQSVSIVYPRRIGKSSLLYCLALPEIQKRFSSQEIFSKSYFDLPKFLSFIFGKMSQDSGKIITRPIKVRFCDAVNPEGEFNPEEIWEIR